MISKKPVQRIGEKAAVEPDVGDMIVLGMNKRLLQDLGRLQWLLDNADPVWHFADGQSRFLKTHEDVDEAIRDQESRGDVEPKDC